MVRSRDTDSPWEADTWVVFVIVKGSEPGEELHMPCGRDNKMCPGQGTVSPNSWRSLSCNCWELVRLGTSIISRARSAVLQCVSAQPTCFTHLYRCHLGVSSHRVRPLLLLVTQEPVMFPGIVPSHVDISPMSRLDRSLFRDSCGLHHQVGNPS